MGVQRGAAPLSVLPLPLQCPCPQASQLWQGLRSGQEAAACDPHQWWEASAGGGLLGGIASTAVWPVRSNPC